MILILVLQLLLALHVTRVTILMDSVQFLLVGAFGVHTYANEWREFCVLRHIRCVGVLVIDHLHVIELTCLS